MQVKYKKHIFIITFFTISIPFILIADLYPLLRVGMFSEPANTSLEETFTIEQRVASGWTTTSEQDVNIPLHLINYLGRNHYYRKEIDIFLEKIRDSYQGTSDSIALSRYVNFIKVETYPINAK